MPAVTEHAFSKTIAAGTFEPAYYLYGDDDFRKEEAVARTVDAAVPAAIRDLNVDVRRGADVDAAALESLLDTPPMTAARRAIVLRDVGALRKEARRALDRYLERPAANTLLLMVAVAGAKPDRALSDRAVAIEFPQLSGDRLPKWIAHRVRELGATITPQAADMLQAATGPDLASLASELDKLVSYARGATGHAAGGEAPADIVIDDTAVAAVVGVRRGETLGDLLDAVASRDAAAALALVEHVLSQPKTTAVSIIMAFSVQTLALAWGRARLDEGVSRARLSGEYFTLLKETGAYPMRPWGDAVTAWVKAVDGWTAPALDAALDALLAADVALKDTRVSSDEQIIASLVLSMCATSPRRVVARPPSGRPTPTRRGDAKRMAMAVTLMVTSLVAAVGGATTVGAQGADSSRAAPPSAPAPPAPADTGSGMTAADSALQRVQTLVAQGRTDAGRTLVDSVLKTTSPGTMSYASALYTRATLATNADSAEQDYRRLTVEYSSSPRASDALLRLAQLELARGDRAQAADHLARLTREQAPGQTGIAYARTELQVALAYFDLQDAVHACVALLSARSSAPGTDVELRNRIDYNMQRCPRGALAAAPPGAAVADSGRPAARAPTSPLRGDSVGRGAAADAGGSAGATDTSLVVHRVTAKPTAKPAAPRVAATTAPSPKPAPAPAPAPAPSPAPVAPSSRSPSPSPPAHKSASFTVQVAAYDTRQPADSLSAKLTSRGYDARVFGVAKPFRVRIGHYGTEAAADAELRALKAKGLAGFVTAAE